MMTIRPDIHFTLTRAEALVLGDLLNRWEQHNIMLITDESAKYVLYKLSNILDQTLMDEYFDPDYQGIVERAKDNVRMKNSDDQR
jgi:hypothetical protein